MQASVVVAHSLSIRKQTITVHAHNVYIYLIPLIHTWPQVASQLKHLHNLYTRNTNDGERHSFLSWYVNINCNHAVDITVSKKGIMHTIFQ